MASSHADQNIIPLHRGTWTPDAPRYVKPRAHTGAELSRMVGDPDAVFAPEPVEDQPFGLTSLDAFCRAVVLTGAVLVVAMWVGLL